MYDRDNAREWSDEQWAQWNYGEWGNDDGDDDGDDDDEDEDNSHYWDTQGDTQGLMQTKAEPADAPETKQEEPTTGVKKELSKEVAAMIVPTGPDGICRSKAPWAIKAHLQNNLREQKVPGTNWVTDQGERVWTNAQTGQTFQCPGCFYQ